MATGDSNDILSRVKRLIPKRWFSFVAPLRDALLGGLSDLAAWNYSWITYARLQIRLKTVQAPWLDVASYDFMGTTLPRRSNEGDPAFSTRLIKEILRPRNTRAAINQVLLDLTGNPGIVQEPWNPRDWGGYGLGMCGYGIALGYGSLSLNNQIFIRAYRPNGLGIPGVAGYGIVYGGYGKCGSLSMYGSINQVIGPITDQEIYQRIAQTISAGITAWVDIQSGGTGTPVTAAPGALIFQGNNSLAMFYISGYYW